jgi:hypothetical protein
LILNNMKYSVAIPENLDIQLSAHLIRKDRQEDLCFALYNPGSGHSRYSGVIQRIILPLPGERQVHGNVSFNPDFYDRVCGLALASGSGICFLHSHPSKGWQGMSTGDIAAEKMLAPRVKATTSLPLIGLTLGTDRTWSARFWIKTGRGSYQRKWCESVRVAGKSFRVYYDDRQKPPPTHDKSFQRTKSSWGIRKQADIARLHIGIVGLGSVGSIVAEALLKSGVRRITLIDFDTVELKNLDRLQGIGRRSIGQLKIDVVKRRLVKQRLVDGLVVNTVPYSIVEQEGLPSALDCDVLFSCVDRPWARYVLNCISYANCIPVIDGGIDAGIRADHFNLDYARWKAHAVAPGRICLNCLGQYCSEDVGLEQSGLLDDPAYIKGLSRDHFINRGENVFGFSLGVGAMEIGQFLSLVLQPRGQYYGPKEFDFNSGNIDSDFEFDCQLGCGFRAKIAEGDRVNLGLTAKHLLAEAHRKKARKGLIASLLGIF